MSFTNISDCGKASLIGIFASTGFPPSPVIFTYLIPFGEMTRLKYYLILCLCFGILHPLAAQLLTTNSIGLTINPGASLTIFGDVRNNGTAVISNNGVIELSGNWINNTSGSVFGTSAGTVIFSGTTQQIEGTTGTLFHHLILDGTTEVTLLRDTETGGSATTGVFNVGDGTMLLNGHSVHVKNPSTGAVVFASGGIVSEATDNSSRVKWDIGTTTGSHIIPFKTAAGQQIPVNIELTTGDAGTVQATTYLTDNLNQPFPTTPELVTHVRNTSGLDNSNNMVDRFWYLEKSGITGSSNITFTYSPADVAGSGNLGPRAQRWSVAGDGWIAVAPGQSNPTAFSTRVPGVNVFGTWALANEPTPLPIELLYFDAKLNNEKKVDIAWVTVMEINNDFFTVERSRDGSNFERLEVVDGAGNSNTTLHYSTVDPSPYPGISYYRLKQTDFDGMFTYSQTVAINIPVNIFGSVSVYPNPVRDHFFLNLEGMISENSEILFEIHDAAGRLVAVKTIQPDVNSGSVYRFERGSLAAGVYSFSVTSGNRHKFTGRLVMD